MSHTNAKQSKRGYLANLQTIPPLIYPFQYNPTQLTDAKSNTFTDRKSAYSSERGVAGLKSFEKLSGGNVAAHSEKAAEFFGRVFSGASLKEFGTEGARTISFKFTIDGREQRPGEPARRRKVSGDILDDLAILRSFVYPQLGELTDLVSQAIKGGAAGWAELWFKEPPTALLVFGDLIIEGYVTNLSITETLFNDELNPVRADVDISLEEKIDSLTFVLDSVKRLGRTAHATAYENIGEISL